MTFSGICVVGLIFHLFHNFEHFNSYYCADNSSCLPQKDQTRFSHVRLSLWKRCEMLKGLLGASQKGLLQKGSYPLPGRTLSLPLSLSLSLRVSLKYLTSFLCFSEPKVNLVYSLSPLVSMFKRLSASLEPPPDPISVSAASFHLFRFVLFLNPFLIRASHLLFPSTVPGLPENLLCSNEQR